MGESSPRTARGRPKIYRTKSRGSGEAFEAKGGSRPQVIEKVTRSHRKEPRRRSTVECKNKYQALESSEDEEEMPCLTDSGEENRPPGE